MPLMPAWCQFYGQTAREFWNLTTREYEAMEQYRRDYMKAMAGGR
jgi:hypothetical protein